MFDVEGQHPHGPRGEGETDDRESAGPVFPGGPGLSAAPSPLAGASSLINSEDTSPIIINGDLWSGKKTRVDRNKILFRKSAKMPNKLSEKHFFLYFENIL